MRSKLFIVISCIFSTAIFSPQAASSIKEWGRVNMQGAIIDASCAIAVESREQTVEMGIVPLIDIAREGYLYNKKFSIQLVNCLLHRVEQNHREQFQVTFDGDAEGDLFSVHGTASGIALQITDRLGNVVLPGNALPFVDITPGKRRLDYTVKLVRNNKNIISGDYFSLVRFTLDYL
jgi:type 1 fimbria pilin